MSRADQMLEDFERFHRKNPDIWRLFERFTLELINRGREYYSVSAVFERIRWETAVSTTGAEVKLNNNHKAFYARLWNLTHENHAGFFRTRRLLSLDRDEYDDDQQVFNFGQPVGEEKLLARLALLLKKYK